MAKVQYRFFVFCFLLMSLHATSQNNYSLVIEPVDKSESFLKELELQNSFSNKEACAAYLQQLIAKLQAKGFVTSSIDSVRLDSANAYIKLFIGTIYKWENITANAAAAQWLKQIGWNEHSFGNQQLNYAQVQTLQEKMLDYFEKHGYPFATIFLDSFQFRGDKVSARFNIKTGPLYKIDSIQITGNAKISNDYLQSFLDIKNGSVYNKEKLQNISTRLKQLNYVEEIFPPKFYWNSSGGVVALFLQQKKSSQVNFIIGFLPNNENIRTNKMLITGEGLLNLKNALGSGETIGVVWQRLQAASQRLNLIYQQPYLFKTPLGIDFSFDMLKRDSAFLNFNFKLGAQYILNTEQSVKLFLQQFNTILGTVNTALVLQTRALPQEADVSLTNIGFEYNLNTTNYIYNPVKGVELIFTSTAGNRKLKRNNQILELKDDNDPDFNFASLYDTVKIRSYQFRSIFSAAKYFPLGNKMRNTIKTGFNGGYIGSAGIFRNELFQIGGYRLLRGFDEQSQFLSQYAIGTVEYRYLVGQNSYFNVFADGGWGRNASRGINVHYNYFSAGAGLAFETKAGLFNLTWAVGKRNDTELNLRQSKIHFGFVNYF
jgi:outer membrane protein assembly factor BamA